MAYVWYYSLMRLARLKAPPDAPTAYYHCISRVVDRRFIFGPEEKERFVKLMRLYEAFCGVHVLTYVVMSNHFHILVEVPKCPDQPLSFEETLARVETLHGALYATNLRDLLVTMTQQDAKTHLDGYRRRMYDVSWFIRMIKQRFSQWYNARTDRVGTLWEQRFKSILVEGAGQVLAAMAAYIDLNPVRVGVCLDPTDYRWCGYAEAVAGDSRARAGIGLVMKGLEKRKWAGVLEGYRVWLFGQADAVRGHGGVTPERVEEVVRAKGTLPVTEYLRCRVRYFVDGTVLGSKAFVESVFESQRWRFGAKRKSGARRVRWLEGVDLFTLRNLTVRVLEGLRLGPAGPETEASSNAHTQKGE